MLPRSYFNELGASISRDGIPGGGGGLGSRRVLRRTSRDSMWQTVPCSMHGDI